MSTFTPYTFVALKDFWSDELKSQYVAGLSYTVREPMRDLEIEDEADDRIFRLRTRLTQLVPQWAAQGKVASSGIPAAQVSGVGKVGG